MNNPKTPYHAVGHYCFDGSIPFQSGLPREEDDFETIEQAREFLEERGGGLIQRCCNHCQHFADVETVKPLEPVPGRPVIHSSRRIKRG